MPGLITVNYCEALDFELTNIIKRSPSPAHYFLYTIFLIVSIDK